MTDLSDARREREKRLAHRNKLIVHRYLECKGWKYKGRVQMLSEQAILEMLSDEFFLSTRSIDDIINGRA